MKLFSEQIERERGARAVSYWSMATSGRGVSKIVWEGRPRFITFLLYAIRSNLAGDAEIIIIIINGRTRDRSICETTPLFLGAIEAPAWMVGHDATQHRW
jgi:hypothetical protein